MIGVVICMVLLIVTILASAYRMTTGPTDADRALAADLLFFTIIGVIALVGILISSSATYDILLIATLVGFLAIVSLARALTRGKR